MNTKRVSQGPHQHETKELETESSLIRQSDSDEEGEEDYEEATLCMYCHEAGNEATLLLCDGSLASEDDNPAFCPNAAHMECMSPPLSGIPDGEWYCEVCSVESRSNSSLPPQSSTSLSKMTRQPYYNEVGLDEYSLRQRAKAQRRLEGKSRMGPTTKTQRKEMTQEQLEQRKLEIRLELIEIGTQAGHHVILTAVHCSYPSLSHSYNPIIRLDLL